MRLSFIVTSYNIATYIGPCLDSLRPCLRPGDEVIVIDDGSRDGTAERIERLANEGLGPDIAVRSLLLGANTPGGVGFAANLGLDAATGEAVAFVDGDDLMRPEEFAAARAAFEVGRPDILIADYLEAEDGSPADQSLRRPADASAWEALAAAGIDTRGRVHPAAKVRIRALGLIAVPWRKIYRRDFLEAHGLRFPVGDFFYEDNPFHWAVCLATGTIAFHGARICVHRIGRIGQTMSARGRELSAFFTHHATISALLDARGTATGAPERHLLADWLVGNMAWHLERLQDWALWDYALAAAPALRSMDAETWAGLEAGRHGGTATLAAVDQLRRLGPGEVVALWQIGRTARATKAIHSRLGALEAETAALRDAAKITIGDLNSLRLITEFEALTALGRDGSKGCS